MKSTFENWLLSQKISPRAIPLFDEAIKTYRVSAYKASLLFSYLGFLTILKQRLIESQRPPAVPEGMWNQLINTIQDSESWDKKMFEATQQQQPSPIFPISESLRREVMYWKDRRNDCAHHKHEKIDYHHVESFWSFLETNLSKFTVVGGYASLLKKFENHFDISLTPPGKDFTLLVQEIQSSIEVARLPAFFQDLYMSVGDHWDDESLKIFNSILEQYENFVSIALMDYLKEDLAKLLLFLRAYPEKILNFTFTPEFIRNLWFNELFKGRINDFDLYTSLLRNNLIAAEDIPEANKKILGRSVNNAPKPFQIQVLKNAGFYELLSAKILPPAGIQNFDLANSYANLVFQYAEIFGFDLVAVRSTCATFSRNVFPAAYLNKLRTYFAEHLLATQQFLNIVKENEDINLPDHLQFLREA